jgi:hypothetical protein
MPINEATIAPKSRATVIGYGRVTSGDISESDNASGMLDDPTRYPGIRKSADLEISIVRNTIDAYALPNGPDRSAGGLCMGDFGGPLILEDGSLGGIASQFTQNAYDASLFDGVALCRSDAGGQYVNLRFGKNPAWIAPKLAALAP